MASPTIHRNNAVYSASAAVGAIARALSEIKSADGLTDDDMGAVLGRSADQAAKYRTGLATMDAVTFGRAKREWNGRFTGYFDRLCEDSRPGRASDREHECSILKAALALSLALADDNEITPGEVHANRQTIEGARDALDALLAKLKPGAVA